MNIVYQLIYAAIGIGLTVLDFYIYKAYVPDVHHSIYIDISTITDSAEGVALFIALLIGVIVESGIIKTHSSKQCFVSICWIMFAAITLESLARITSMTIVSIHVHPGKIDFLGLFVLINMEYFILKYSVIMHHMFGLIDKVNSVVVPSINFFASYEQNKYLAYQAVMPHEQNYFPDIQLNPINNQ